jgi:acyl-coenzyme A thioesterase PaaI-like protein
VETSVTDTEDDIREFARVAPVGRIAGNGHPLMPPWQVAESGPEEVTMRGHVSRFHVGGNGAVHGGVTPAVLRLALRHGLSSTGRPDSRTAYLHVGYRKITPADEPLVARAWVDSVEGRKMVVMARMTDADGHVLSEASGLMIKLRPHQP